MRTATEHERKYEVAAGFRVPTLADTAPVAGVGAPVEHQLDATYYDTPDLRLARNRVTLRRRRGGADAGWHLKQPTDRGKTETQAPLGERRQPPPKLLKRISDLVDGEPLRPVARIRTRRLERPLRSADGTVLALLADDTVTSQTPGRRDTVLRHWRELEVELVHGREDVLDTVEAVLRDAGARPARATSKLARALADRLPPEPEADAGTPAPRRDTPLSAYLWEQADAFDLHEAGARTGDPTAVHKLRVATRRLRSTLRTFRPLLDPVRTEGLAPELKWLADALGGVRDGQVVTDRLTTAIRDLPAEEVLGPVAARVRQRLAARTGEAQRELSEALDSDRYRSLRAAVTALAADGETAPATPKQLYRRARKALRRADRRLAAAAEAPERPGLAEPSPAVSSADERRHEARKAYKRARYAVEVLAPVGGKAAEKLVDRLTDLQDVLGAHQDTLTSRELLRTYGVQAHLDGENGFTYGLLYAREQAGSDRTLDRLPAVSRRATRRKVRRWLDRPGKASR